MAKKHQNWSANFAGLTLIHQKIAAHEVGQHTHKEYEIFLPLQGSISVHCAAGRFSAGPGHMLFVPPNMDHRFTSTAEGSGERIIILIEADLWRRHARGTEGEPVVMTNDTLAKELIFYLLLNPKRPGQKYFVEALVETLAARVESSKARHQAFAFDLITTRVKDQRIVRVIEDMNRNFATLKLTEAARRHGLSLRNLNRLFVLETGLSPKDFLIRRRIAAAKDRLVESKLTITDIALEVGYNSLSKFIAAFKKFEGQLPSDFRQRK